LKTYEDGAWNDKIVKIKILPGGKCGTRSGELCEGYEAAWCRQTNPDNKCLCEQHVGISCYCAYDTISLGIGDCSSGEYCWCGSKEDCNCNPGDSCDPNNC